MRPRRLFLFVLFLIACSARVETPQVAASAATDGSDAAAEAQDAVQEAEEALEAEAQEAVEEPLEASVEAQEAAPTVPETLAQKFVAAGGQKLCLAMVYALNPDWRMDACVVIGGREGDEARKTECENQRRPLRKFAEDVCAVILDESLKRSFDPGMVISVIERESSFGRATWDQQDRRYEVQTDVCRLTLPKSRIVDRRPGRREGTELMTWTYGPQAPVAGAVARNRQPVRVVEEDDERVVLDTCAAGETGIMQTVPREYRSGVVIETTGQRMTGSPAERRAEVEADPLLQVRLGCQALADHRDLCEEDRRGDWTTWLPTYNLGTCSPTWSKWNEYLGKVMKHYLDACEKGWIAVEGEVVPRSIRDVWPECARIQEVYDALRNRDEE